MIHRCRERARIASGRPAPGWRPSPLYWVQTDRGGGPVLEERLKAGAHPRLDAFHSLLLDVPAERLREPGTHVIATERRARPGWGGYITPIYAISTPLGGVISCRIDLVNA